MVSATPSRRLTTRSSSIVTLWSRVGGDLLGAVAEDLVDLESAGAEILRDLVGAVAKSSLIEAMRPSSDWPICSAFEERVSAMVLVLAVIAWLISSTRA